MPTTTNIEIYRGEDVILNFTMDPVEDISTWTIVFTVSRGKNSTIKAVSIDCALTTDGSDGAFMAQLTDAETDGLYPGTYYWDAWKSNPGGERILGIGKFTVLPNVRIPEEA